MFSFRMQMAPLPIEISLDAVDGFVDKRIMATPRKIRCTVSEILSHGERVYTLRLAPERPLPVFQAGQFLHLTIDPFDPSSFWPESRAFSIASHPSQRESLEVVYSAVGSYTARMEQELKVGSEVWVKLPYGEFMVQQNHDLVLIAGGTGFSAFTSFLRDYDPAAADARRVHLIYGARRPELLLYADEFLKKAAQSGGRLTIDLLAENGAEGAVSPGRISLERIWARVPDADARAFYLSGPPTMIRAMSSALSEKDIPEDRIRVDAWE